MYVVGDWVKGNVGNLSFGDCGMDTKNTSLPITIVMKCKNQGLIMGVYNKLDILMRYIQTIYAPFLMYRFELNTNVKTI